MGLQVFGSLAVDVSKVIAVAGRSVLVQGVDSTLRVESDTESVDKLLEYLAEVVKIREVNIKDSNERIDKLFEELMNDIKSGAAEVDVVSCGDPDCKLCKPAAVAPVAPEVTSAATSDSPHSDLPVEAPVDVELDGGSIDYVSAIQADMNADLAASSVQAPPSSPAVAIPAEPAPVVDPAPVPAAQPVEIIQPDPVQSLDDLPVTIVPEFDPVVKLTPVDSLPSDDDEVEF